jgi:anti-sigma B factor antagonist
MMQISVRQLDKITVFDISGDIDLATSPELRKALLRELKDRRMPRVVVNLQAVQYVDSSGVASLVEGLKASRDVGSRFVLCGLNTKVKDVLRLSRLGTIFEVCDSEEQALAP